MAVKFSDTSFNLKIVDFLRISLIIILVSTIIFFLLLPSYTKLKELKRQKKAIEAEIEQLRKELVHLKQENKRLADESFYSEKVLRDKLGLSRKGDVVIKVEGRNNH